MAIRIRRREFIFTLGCTVTWSLVARAQQPYRMYQIGILMDISQDDRVGQQYVSAFLHGLRERNWRDGDNIRIDYRWGAADVGRVRSSAIELVNLKPDVILAQGSLAVSALIGVTSTIPIVFVQVGDPVGSGIVASLARPGGNITGFTPAEFSMSGNGLEVLKEVAPRQDSTRRKTGRTSGRAADQVRSHHQPDDREGTRSYDPRSLPVARRRGNRMMDLFAALHMAAFGTDQQSISAQLMTGIGGTADL